MLWNSAANNYKRHNRLNKLTIVFVAMMVLLMAVMPLQADEEPSKDFKISVETKELLLEEIPANRLVELKIFVENLPAFRTLRIILEKDSALKFPFPSHLPDPSDALARVGGISCSTSKDPNTNWISCMIDNVEPDLFLISGEIMTLYFTLPNDAQPGDFYQVKLLRNYDDGVTHETYVETDDALYGESYFSELVSGGIRIVSSHDDPTDKPTPTPTSTPISTPTSDPSTTGGGFEDFVERLYTVALNRASEPEGKAFWCEHVGNGDLNGAQCANEFLLSKEFNDRKLTDEQFLEVLYKTFFDRDAKDDKDGFNFWMNSLKTEGRDKVVDGFINSTEWCNICASYGVKSGATRAKATIASKNATAFATRLYTECLGRDPEEGGLKFWSLGLTNLELTGSAAAHEFFFCKEFNDHNFNNKELITRMYRTFMGREPDDNGMMFWLDSMDKGMTKQDVFDCFVKSPEFTQICKDYAIERG